MASRQMQELISTVRSAAQGRSASVQDLRASQEQMLAAFPPPVDGVAIEPLNLVGDSLLFTPEDPRQDLVILYLHGGGYALGSARQHQSVISRVADLSRCRVVGLDYRLAPENPFPAALQDAQAAYAHCLTLAPRVAVMGDSAGGGLAACLALRLRDTGATAPTLAVLMSPWLDLSCAGESIVTNSHEGMFTADEMRQWAAAYAGDMSLTHPEISPNFADLSGLPPMLILIGSDEMALDDSLTFTHRAAHAGVAVDLQVWPEVLHAWPVAAGMAPEADQALAVIMHFIERTTQSAESSGSQV